jgi:ABC-type sugar transport system ATPase subunit
VSEAAPPLLEIRALAKRYAGATALKGMDLAAEAGEVHAIVGANGAGKSTLMNLLSGVIVPTSGEIRIDGEPVALSSPAVAQGLGIATVHQEFSLVPQLSVARNIFLGREPADRIGWVDRRRLSEATRALCDRYHLHLDPEAEVNDLSVAEQQLVEIARALSVPSRILILDEPTAVLSLAEQTNLFSIIGKLKASGMLVLYVSHRLQEILSIADRATVLRDGEKVATRPVTGLSMDELVFLMIGAASTSRAPRMASGRGTQLFDIRYRVGADESRLLLRGGEIVGLAGLVGAGRTTFARALAGAGRARAGVTLFRAGVEERIASPREAMRAGVAYLTEDRKRDGLFANLDIVANTSAAALTRVSCVGFRRPGRERKLAGGILERLRLQARTLDMPAGQLSGGNQQKVVFGRALLRAPQLLICDEPTRGVDVRTKGEIHSILAELAGQGVAVLVISSEIDELLAISHRIVVMRDRMLVAEMPVEEADEVSILVAASGGRQQQPVAVK